MSIERHLSTARIANVVADFDEAAEAVGTNCESWVGTSNPMIPLLDPSVARTQGWFRLLEELDPEHIVRQSPGPATLPAVPWPTLGYPTPLIVVLDALLNGKASRRITVPLLENDDPWRLAYVGCLGSLPEYISPSVSARAFLRGDLRYDDLLTIERVSVDGSATTCLIVCRLGEQKTCTRFRSRCLAYRQSIHGTVARSLLRSCRATNRREPVSAISWLLSTTAIALTTSVCCGICGRLQDGRTACR